MSPIAGAIPLINFGSENSKYGPGGPAENRQGFALRLSSDSVRVGAIGSSRFISAGGFRFYSATFLYRFRAQVLASNVGVSRPAA